MPNVSKKMIAEAIGTFILVFVAVGAARVLGAAVAEGNLAYGASVAAISIAFGAALIGAAYSIGPISGCHINPAVSIGAWASGRMSISEMIQYIIAQCVGAIAAAFVLTIVVAGLDGTISGANAYGEGSFLKVNFLRAAVFEFAATFLFVFIILGVTAKANQALMAGAAIGITLIGIHLVGIPITGTSVNPARSLGPALFAGEARAIGHLWVFLVFPALGGLAAGLAWRTLFNEPEEANMD